MINVQKIQYYTCMLLKLLYFKVSHSYQLFPPVNQSLVAGPS